MSVNGNLERRGSRQTGRRPGASRPDRGSSGTYKKVKELTDALTSVTTVGYRVAAGIGALATFAYLRLIEFFPSGMTPGEVLFFLFIAFAFAITYLLMIGYGAFSTLWLVKALTRLRNVLSFDDATLASRLFNDLATQDTRRSMFRDRWQSVRMRATRARLDNLYAAPASAQGWFIGLGSLFVFVYFVASAIEFDSVPFTELVIATTFAGFVALSLASVRSESGSLESQRAKFIGLALAPVIILVFYAGPRPLLNMVFQGLGIYVPRVSLELPASELGAVERLSEHIDRPLVDCHRPSPAMILVHGADVLWTGIGDQTVIRFSAIETKPRTLFSPASAVRQAQLKFDTKSSRILKTEPRIDPCFTLSSDVLFKNGEPILTTEGDRSLRNLTDAVKGLGRPAKIVVRSHSDVRPNVVTSRNGAISDDILSQQRAVAVANGLRSLFDNKTIEIFAEGVGSREIRNKCEPDAKSSPYEIAMCSKANRRVEISVAYRK
jgi:outer membrane protein OmpA-like peptidoglycan-associated protein